MHAGSRREYAQSNDFDKYILYIDRNASTSFTIGQDGKKIIVNDTNEHIVGYKSKDGNVEGKAENPTFKLTREYNKEALADQTEVMIKQWVSFKVLSDAWSRTDEKTAKTEQDESVVGGNKAATVPVQHRTYAGKRQENFACEKKDTVIEISSIHAKPMGNIPSKLFEAPPHARGNQETGTFKTVDCIEVCDRKDPTPSSLAKPTPELLETPRLNGLAKNARKFITYETVETEIHLKQKESIDVFVSECIVEVCDKEDPNRPRHHPAK
jgi:hypothetical protein